MDLSRSLPGGLDWLRGSERGRTWLASLPQLLDECASEWGLRLGEPFRDAFVSLPVAVTLPAGADAVLKIQFPHRESEHEAHALRHWDGEGAIRLLAHDSSRHALLLERCVPGTPLSACPSDEALGVLVGLLPRLWQPAAPPFRTLAEEAGLWASTLVATRDSRRREVPTRLVGAALDALRSLATSQGEQVLLHQDLHADNVLRSQREPWLVIDPKPLAGEREFGIAPIVRSFELGHGERDVRRRLDRLTSELGLDRERARLWTIGQTVAWAFDGGYSARHVETAAWLLDA